MKRDDVKEERMPRYKIGDKVWVPYAESRGVRSECPVCAGKLTATVMLGNGDSVVVPCDYCGIGYEGPRGFVKEYEWTSGVEQRTVTKIEVAETSQGTEVEYLLDGSWVGQEDRMYDDQDAALEACKVICDKLAIEQRTRPEHIKAQQAKSYTWNAGYHLREARRSEKRAAHHREKAVLCKAKAKADTPPSAG